MNFSPTVTDQQSTPILQTQLSAQDTIRRHFSQILKNDSITVTDQTSTTETWMKRENSQTSRKSISFRLIIFSDECY